MTRTAQGRSRASVYAPLLASLILLILGIPFHASATSRVSDRSTNAYRHDRILIKPKAGAAASALNAAHRATGGAVRRSYPSLGNLQVIQLPKNIGVEQAVRAYQESGAVEYAEPDRILEAARVPNESSYQTGPLWNLYNWGQYGAVNDADIDAAEAWDLITDASAVVVSIIDSGIRVTHQDLAPNLWVNPGEVPGNGVDDDQNGYIDDVHGINAIDGSGNLIDEPSHGTHVAGTFAAAGDNGMGIVGVAWRARIMGCKFLNAEFQGAVSDAIECIQYSRANGARIINASWGGRTDTHFFSLALYDAINSLREDGIIFVAAAGNFALDNDASPAFYPATFDLDNIISVAATTWDDLLAHFSDYGADSVDLGAPGYIVYSCWATADNAYDYDNGTSMAAPHVAAACALAWARFPGESYQQIIQRVLGGVEVVAGLAGKCRTRGRLNLAKVLQGAPPPAPSPASLSAVRLENGQFQFRVNAASGSAVRIEASTNLLNWTTVYSGQIPGTGFLDFTDTAAASSAKFYRAVSGP